MPVRPRDAQRLRDISEASESLLRSLWEVVPDYSGAHVFSHRIVMTKAHRLRELLGLSVDDLKEHP